MATTAPIILPIKTPGLSDLQKLEKRMKALENEVDSLTKKLPKASNSVRRFGKSAKQASVGFAALNKAMVKVAAIIATLQGATFIFTSAAELESQAKSLEILTGSAEKAKQVIGEIQEFSAVTPFTSSELIDTTKRLKAFGVETENLVQTTKMLADVSGATGAKINEVALAYGQVQAKGKLQTEELYQLQERGIGIADELKRMYGLQGEEFVKALEKGQISAAAVEQAFVNLTGTTGKYFNGATAQSETLAGKWSTLIDAVTRLAQNIGQTLGPALKGILTLAINITNAIGGMIQKINALLGIGTENAIAKLEKDIASLEGRLGANNGRRDRMMNSQIAQKKTELAELRAELEKTSAAAKAVEDIGTEYTGPLPALLGVDDGSGATGGSGSGTSAATKELDRQREELERQFQAGEDIKRNMENRLMLLRASTDLEKERLQIMFDLDAQIRRIQQTAAPSQQNGLIVTATEEARLKDMLAMAESFGTTVGNNLAKSLPKVNEELTETDKLLRNAYDVMAGGMQDAIKGLITGTKDLNDVLSDMLSQLGDLFLQFAFSSLKTGIFGMANGGYPTPGEPVLVGENGPELIVPTAPTRIYNNHDTNDMLGKYSPGGGGGTITFESRIINNVEYVTTEQAMAMSEDAAKRGAEGGYTKTMGSLRNNRSTRQRVGI